MDLTRLFDCRLMQPPNTSFEFTVHALPWPLTCRAESEEEMRAWVQTLENLCDIVS